MDTLELTPAQLEEALHDRDFRLAYRRSLWYQGDLSAGLRPHGQLWLHNFVKSRHDTSPTAEPFLLETHRRLGKSNLGLRFLVSRGLKRPGQRMIYVAPTKKQAQPIVRPNMAVLCRGCPSRIRPRYQGEGYIIQNPLWPPGSEPSVIEIYGINTDPDAARGAHCDAAVIDEAGYVKRLEYFMGDVLAPQFVGRPDPLVLMLSTPPETMDHPFISHYIPEARSRGRYMGVKGSENPDFTYADEQVVLAFVGSKKSVSWRREVEIEHITDPSSMICPEWLDFREVSIEERGRPDAYIPLVSMDLGWSDFTHALFGYVDFRDQILVIEDEYFTHYESEGPIAEAIRAREAKLWTTTGQGFQGQVRRIADADPLVLRSFYDTFRLRFAPAIRHDKEATLASLRLLIAQQKLRIHPRCKSLIYQLDNGIWKDTPDGSKRDFIRSPTLGHCDGISALAYMNRQAPWKKNPFPPRAIDVKTHGRNITNIRKERRKKRKHPFKKAFQR